MAKSQLAKIEEAAEKDQQGGALRVPHILIVENDLRYALELSRALREPAPNLLCQVDVVPDVESADEYLKQDSIDIYVVDLKLEDKSNPGQESEEVGKAFIAKVVDRSNAGVIVHSSIPDEIEGPRLMLFGVDDYIEKGKGLEITRARLVALWRRIKLTRPVHARSVAHADRKFLIGKFRFVTGSRLLESEGGASIRLSHTEYALIRHLCLVDTHEIDRETFNLRIMGRPAYEKDARIDNLIYRLRTKLGASFQVVLVKEGTYRLDNILEVPL